MKAIATACLAGLCFAWASPTALAQDDVASLIASAESFVLECKSRDGYGYYKCNVACFQNGNEIWSFSEIWMVTASKTAGGGRWWVQLQYDSLKSQPDELVTFGSNVACVFRDMNVFSIEVESGGSGTFPSLGAFGR